MSSQSNKNINNYFNYYYIGYNIFYIISSIDNILFNQLLLLN